MAHLRKFTRAACSHMYKHFNREEDDIGNDCVDRERTHLNYNLAIHQTISQNDFIKKRLSEVRVFNKKDINVMCSWIITLPSNIFEGDEKTFFSSCYEFLENKYGKENVVSAYVHMDETTPHMHFAFIPIVLDKKKGDYKLSAKECITLYDLKRFHSDLEAFLVPRLGYTPNILTGATREGNKSIQELKRHSAREIIQKAMLYDEIFGEEEMIVFPKRILERNYRTVEELLDTIEIEIEKLKVNQGGKIADEKRVTVSAKLQTEIKETISAKLQTSGK